MKTKTLKLDQINTTDGTQVRALNLEVVEDYRERLEAKPDSLPPVEVYGDDNCFWLADGFHRHEASKLAGLQTIKAQVHAGGRTDALEHALGSNVEHGYRRTRADKRNAVIKAFQEFQDRADRYYAGVCKVSPTYVGDIRKELFPSTVHVDGAEATNEKKRVGRDGKARKMPQPKESTARTAKLEGQASPYSVNS